ncbi:MAG: alpha/beta hydrolase [Chloroflexota bacterium]
MTEKLRSIWQHRLFRRFFYIAILFLLAVNVIMPIIYGVMAVTARRDSVGMPPEGFVPRTLTTSDGVALMAWYVPPENGAAIILVHGASGSRETMRPYAQMLVDAGYGVLAFDLRGQGESDGQKNLFGWAGTRDVGAAVAFLQEQPDVEMIGGLGLSLGGEVLLGALSTYPEIAAAVSEGATQRSLEEFRAVTSRRNLLRSMPPGFMYFTVQLLSGDNPPLPLLDSIMQAADTPLLLIAAGNVSAEIDYNTLFAETAGDRAELWLVEDADHAAGYERDSVAYADRVIDFFNAHLLAADA